MAEKINNQNNPFISLNSYKDFNNNLFYSREKQVEDAMTIIQSNSFLAISEMYLVNHHSLMLV